MKYKMEIELDLCGNFDGSEAEEIKWFIDNILMGETGGLILHSNYIGESIGTVKGVKMKGC